MSITPKQAARAVAKAGGNKSAAARALGVTRNVLHGALALTPRATKAATVKDDPRVEKLQQMLIAERQRKVAKLPKPRVGKAPKSIIRVCIPDSHGAHVDWPAADAMVRDIMRLQPDEVVWLGDHLDCGGTFSAHQRSYTNEMTESYDEDVTQGNILLDKVMQAAPNAEHHYLFGNHEEHVQRWAARNFECFRDARLAVERFGPAAMLRLKERGFRWYVSSEQYGEVTIPGTIRLGKCYYTHGIGAGKHATHTHVERFGASVVHGHTHRAQASIQRTVKSMMHGAWCPGTLAKLQPLYRHTTPTTWSHGYIVQFVNVGTGTFATWQIPIFGDKTLLLETIDAIASRRVVA